MELEAGEESDRDIYASGRDATHALSYPWVVKSQQRVIRIILGKVAMLDRDVTTVSLVTVHQAD
jgi:hypothetical protein